MTALPTLSPLKLHNFQALITRFSLVLILISLLSMTHLSASNHTLLIGNFSAENPEENQRGIHVLTLNESGLSSKPQILLFINPEFLCQHPTKMTFYTVNVILDPSGKKQHAISSFQYDTVTGIFQPLNEQPVSGNGPCHIAIDATGSLVVTANYGDGSVSAFPVLADGRLGPESDLKTHKGSGPNVSRQNSPHAHGVTFSPDNRFLLVPDLGTDDVRIYRVNHEAGGLEVWGSAKVAPGAGPRHISFSPDGRHAYLVNELDNTVTAFLWEGDKGGLKMLGNVPTLPAGFEEKNTTAEIVVHPNGRYVYASNRGHNSIAMFLRDEETGNLTPAGHVLLEGPEPRSFALSADGGWLVVGNHRLNTVSAYKILDEGARLEKRGESVGVPSPVCIHFVLAR